ncbi:MAG: hypothetical protein K6W08_10110 [Firmicutes bacterium]|nr:hypothetical protein [Bacillota bacterium]
MSRLTALLTYFHYRDLGQLGRAEDFARRVFRGRRGVWWTRGRLLCRWTADDGC